MDGVKLLVTIIERGRADKVVCFLQEEDVRFSTVVMGKGTAPSQWLNMTGLGDSKKEVIFSAVPQARASEILKKMGERFNLAANGNGGAFTILMNSVAGRRTLKFFDVLKEDN
ncbi:MAG TPA: hypothetical protein P5058_03040 [Eubacteriales bacterium]|nr:hypothetical protein [Eubacteriales bacterium]